MATSGAGAPLPGQGATDGDEASGDGTSFDYQKAYEELRPKATQWSQSAAEAEQVKQSLSEYERLFEGLQDPQTQAEALQALGLELAEDGTSAAGTDADLSDWEDPLEREIQELRGTVDELKSQRELEAETRQEQELIELRDDYIGDAIEYIESTLKESNPNFTGFSEKAELALGNLALSMDDEQGVPDVQGAYNLLYGKEGLIEDERSGWIQTKTGAVQAPGGRSAPAIKKPTTARERAQYFDERLRAMDQDY